MEFPAADVVKATIFIAATLFPIVNPLGGAPIFLSLTGQYSSDTQKLLARKIAINSFALLMASLFVGAHVLAFFGISLPAVQLGGGLIVAATGWTLLNQPDRRDQDAKQIGDRDILSHAFYPYTLPLTVGPGTISVAITLGANLPKRLESASMFSVEALAASLGGAIIICALIWLCYASAERMSRALGPTGTSVVMRLSSFILFCIGVQIAWNGVQGLVKPMLGR
ncbi:MAG TPA: MarC family protein [Paludibaculum sp.]|jgi:multiple antibiotic resistance protein